MISGALYQPFYLILILLLTVFVMRKYDVVEVLPHDYEDLHYKGLAGVLTVFLVFFIGFRPISCLYFGDTGNYAAWYKAHLPLIFKWDWENTNFIFDNIYTLFGFYDIPIEHFFLIIALIYFGGIYWACRTLFHNDLLLVLLVYLGAFSTFSYGTNGIKAGAAASLFLMALAYQMTGQEDDSKWRRLLPFALLFLSLGFHHSMAASLAVFGIALFVRKREFYMYVWLFAFVMAALHITYFQEIFRGLTDESGAGYLRITKEVRYVSGFRPDFILYSAIPVFLGDYIVRKNDIESRAYDFLWSIYTLLNAIFLLCTYGSFINRIAYLSWQIYPFVLIYPFLYFQWHPDQNRFLRYVVYGHLGFTLFMDFIYYGM